MTKSGRKPQSTVCHKTRVYSIMWQQSMWKKCKEKADAFSDYDERDVIFRKEIFPFMMS